SYEEHERLLDWEREMMARIDVPYRIIDTAAGDLGTSAARKFDCEAWMPSQDTYRELTSTSNTTQFQARRLNIRERTEEGLRPVATLNGTPPPPASSPRSPRTPSRPTARSWSPRDSARTSAGARSSRSWGAPPEMPAPRPLRRLLGALRHRRSTRSSGADGTLEDMTSTATTDREATRTRLEEHL